MARRAGIYLNHCGIAPLYKGALKAGQTFAKAHSRLGIRVINEYGELLDKLHKAVGAFLETEKQNISFIHNTAEGLSLLAEGFPFQKGDEIISYVHEYPSNHYPWLLQERRGARLLLLENKDMSKNKGAGGRPCAFSIEDLEKKITKRTRIIALSHVQFTSGFACELERLGQICKERGIHLCIDAAQSMGALPLFPEKWNIDAVAASGWKWLLGPIGSGLLYTSPKLREKLGFSMAGADLMEQGEDYLNHSWKPYLDGRRFEYSTASYEFAAQLLSCFHELFNVQGIEKIWARIRELQKLFLSQLEPSLYDYLEFAPQNKGPILALIPRLKEKGSEDLSAFIEGALAKGLLLSSRGGYLRLGIHFYNTPKELRKAAKILNHVAKDFL